MVQYNKGTVSFLNWRTFHFHTVRSVSHEVKITFIPTSAVVGMCSIYIWQLVWPVAAPLVMCMRGYIGGVATVRVLLYPALSGFVLSGLQFAVWKNHSENMSNVEISRKFEQISFTK